MFNFKDSHICSENINFLEQIIMDIENYPEFVPWCEQAKIADVTNERILAKLVIVYKGIITSYKSTVYLSENKTLKSIFLIVFIDILVCCSSVAWSRETVKFSVVEVK